MTTAGPFSCNEIAFYITRAVFGAGVPWGIAEDAARACIQIVKDGGDPAPLLAQALTSFEARPDGARLVIHDDGSEICIAAEDGGPASALFAAPAWIDWRAVAAPRGGSAVLGPVDVPDLCDALVRAEAGDGLPRSVDVDADAWAVVMRFFGQSLVPASADSREGAGAGLVDRD